MGFKDKLPSEISMVRSSVCQLYICPNVSDICQFYPDLIMFITNCNIEFDNFYQKCSFTSFCTSLLQTHHFFCIKNWFPKTSPTNHWTRTVARQDAAKDAKDRATSDPFAIFLKVRVVSGWKKPRKTPYRAIHGTGIFIYLDLVDFYGKCREGCQSHGCYGYLP